MQRCCTYQIIRFTVEIKIILQGFVHEVNQGFVLFLAELSQKLQMLCGDERLQRNIQPDHQHGKPGREYSVGRFRISPQVRFRNRRNIAGLKDGTAHGDYFLEFPG
ncbi:hypothetical protein D3C75_1127360 [compost metagenome]